MSHYIYRRLPPTCIYFNRQEGCKHGQRCKFLHVKFAPRPAPPPEPVLPPFAIEAGKIVDSWNAVLAEKEHILNTELKQAEITLLHAGDRLLREANYHHHLSPSWRTTDDLTLATVCSEINQEIQHLEYHGARFFWFGFKQTFDFAQRDTRFAKQHLAGCTTPQQVIECLNEGRGHFEKAIKTFDEAVADKNRAFATFEVYEQRCRNMAIEVRERTASAVKGTKEQYAKVYNTTDFPVLCTK